MGKSRYIMQFGGLAAGVHEYEFVIDGTFFKGFEHGEITAADIEVKAFLTKQNNVLQVRFELEGTVDLDCDRCMKAFAFPVSSEETLVIKHGDPDESTDEIVVIPEGQEEVDLSHYLFEYVTLAVPARRVPCEETGDNSQCDYETLDKLKDHSVEETGTPDEQNPIWEKLNKIKFNKN